MNKVIDRKKLNKKIFFIVCALVFALGLLISILTLSFFSGNDEVTNKVSATDVKIELLEPDWVDHGKSDAQTLEPGMIIDKNPQVLNKSESDVYVRMRFVIKVKDTEITAESNPDKYYRIMSAINFIDSYNSDDGGNMTNIVYKPFVELTTNGQIVNNTNPEFAMMYGGWYYYYKNGSLTALESGKTTPELFSFLKIPTLKTEYNGYFDSGFSILVEAQAISASIESDDFDKVKEEFELRYEVETG